LLEEVAKCSYVLEYEGEVYARKDRRTHEREYASNNEGCYILDAQTPEGWVCIDSTRHLFSPGRLLNHAPSTKATLTPFKPLLIRREWRVGFKATRDLHVGEELIWDYGCPPGGIDWLFRRPVKSQNVADTGGEYYTSLNSCRVCLCR
jgi:histone-lysine N-methyltransferase EZH2